MEQDGYSLGSILGQVGNIAGGIAQTVKQFDEEDHPQDNIERGTSATRPTQLDSQRLLIVGGIAVAGMIALALILHKK